jgi:hypothetical protein
MLASEIVCFSEGIKLLLYSNGGDSITSYDNPNGDSGERSDTRISFLSWG